MINPGVLVAGIVAALRAVPELVAECNHDELRINAYVDRYPDSASIARAVWKMPNPSILIAYQGFGPGRVRAMETWRHQVTVFLKLRELGPDEASEAYYRALELLVNGVTTVSGQRMLATEVVADCYAMDVPSAGRRSLVIDQVGTTIDYWEFTAVFTEKGDA